MKIFISSDHGGLELKENIKENFPDLIDLGPFELKEDDDYPDYAIKLVDEIKNNKESLGILICRSGNGMCIAANKNKDIYAALCFTPKHAEMARKHDNANVLCLDSDYSDSQQQLEIVKSFINSQFEGFETRHGRRFLKVKGIEEENFK